MRLLTTRDVARRADLSSDAVRKAARLGQIRAVRSEGGVFIFREADVNRWLERRERRNAALTAGGAA